MRVTFEVILIFVSVKQWFNYIFTILAEFRINTS